MTLIGGDIALMANLSRTFGARGEDLTNLMTAIEGPVGESASYWKGGKQNQLIQAWQAAKPAMTRLAQELHEYGHFTTTTASNIEMAAN